MIDELVDTLLYEGYALYPYTPGATKNATPTPFGIVYPPAYAAECAGALDHARLECVTDGGSALHATIRWLEASGERHEAAAQRTELGPVGPGERTTVEGARARFTLRWGEDGVARCCVHNTAEVEAGLDRARALQRALISVHIVVEIEDGRFVSPLEAGRESVNTWPVLATPTDDAVLGAAIVLPDHPQIAPQSRGNLFDNTEIEEALVLHVHSLTDEERASASHDPTVRAMLDRALALTGDDIIDLHGGLKEIDAPFGELGGGPLGEIDNNPGEQRVTVGGVTFEKGAKLVLRPGTDRDVYDRMLDGRRATIERIYLDYDDKVYLGVTVDDDPGQQLMRETGRYLFFFANEVEAL
ncbi:MAG: hypothetical protein ACLPV4_06140 [Solirubrobacteraceae bacterium]